MGQSEAQPWVLEYVMNMSGRSFALFAVLTLMVTAGSAVLGRWLVQTTNASDWAATLVFVGAILVVLALYDLLVFVLWSLRRR